MIESQGEYKKAIGEILKEFKKQKKEDLRARFIYRYRAKIDSTEDEKLVFLTENMEINEEAKVRMQAILSDELDRMAKEDRTIHKNYKLDYQIGDGNVGILNEDFYPQELKDLIAAFKLPDSDGSPRSKKKSVDTDKMPVAFVISFNNIFYIKKIDQLKVASAKKMKDALIMGTKTRKITSFDEDFMLITLRFPDMIIYNDESGIDPTFVYSSYNFGNICATVDFMRRNILSDGAVLNNVLDNLDPLLEYLKRAWMVVPPLYFTIKRSDFGPLDKNYISILNEKFFEKRLKADNDGRLITKGLTGKEIYYIILNKYGVKFGRKGEEELGVIEVFHATIN